MVLVSGISKKHLFILFSCAALHSLVEFWIQRLSERPNYDIHPSPRGYSWRWI
jgi:hypothetical protein